MEDPNDLRRARDDQPVVLVVDDEVMVCNIARFALEHAGLFVLTARDGEEALLMSRKFPGTIHAGDRVIAAVVKPGGTGPTHGGPSAARPPACRHSADTS
jgi:CheY-like chemotaxis protein